MSEAGHGLSLFIYDGSLVQLVMQLPYMTELVPSEAMAFRQEGDKDMSGYVQGRSLGSMILQS